MTDYEKPVCIVQIRLYHSNLMATSHNTGYLKSDMQCRIIFVHIPKYYQTFMMYPNFFIKRIAVIYNQLFKSVHVLILFLSYI